MPSKSARLRRRQKKTKMSTRRRLEHRRKHMSRQQHIDAIKAEIAKAEALLEQGKQYRRHGKFVSLDELYAELTAVPLAFGQHPLLEVA